MNPPLNHFLNSLLSATRIVLPFQISSEGFDEFDESRVSTNQDEVDFHNLKIAGDPPQRAAAIDRQQQKQQQQAVNPIVKPLTPLTPKNRGQDPLKAEVPIRRSSQAYYPDVRSKGNSTARKIPAQQTSDPQQSPTTSGRQVAMGQSKQVAAENCHPMKLTDFQRVSLATGEMVVRDAEGRPCYTLTICGYIQWNDDSLFPLKNFKVYQHTIFELSDGGARLVRPLNCSVTGDCGTGTDLTGLYQKQIRSFREEIIVFVDCGYLVLRTRVLGPYMSLESLSFYRTTVPAVSSKSVSKSSRKFVKIVSQMQPQDLIFSTDGTKNHPLFFAPLVFIYTCSNRIELTGNNSVKLVLEKFEIQRSAYLIPEIGSTLKPASGTSELSNQESGPHEFIRSEKSLLNIGKSSSAGRWGL